MSLPQLKFREIIFLILYAELLGISEKEATLELVMEQLKVTKANALKGYDEAKNIAAKFTELDLLISKMVFSYDFERIQSIEKTALRLGAYELIYEKKIPPKVAISEAIRLTKKFGTPAATAFVNAVLDGLFKADLGHSIDQISIEKSIKQLEKSENIPHAINKKLDSESDDRK